MESKEISMIQVYNALTVHDYTSIFREEDFELAPSKYVITSNEGDLNHPRPIAQLEFHSGEIQNGINGIMGENLLAIELDRLSHFQKTKFKCKENEKAIECIEEALMWLQKRNNERKLLGIEGTHKLEGDK